MTTPAERPKGGRGSGWRIAIEIKRASDKPADAYYEWAVYTGFRYYGDAAWVPVLIELKPGTRLASTACGFARLLARLQRLAPGVPEWPGLRLPHAYTDLPRRLQGRELRFVSGLATPKFLAATYAGGGAARLVLRFEIGRATPPSTLLTTLAAPPLPPPLPPHAVVIGVIDDGLAFAHGRFTASDGTTRIESFWDQRVPSKVWGDWTYGRQITKRDPVDGIDRLMNDSRHGLRVDEDEVYRRSGHLDPARPGPQPQPLARAFAHGTHVLDLAGGSRTPPAPGLRTLVAVQLPAATVEDTSGATLGPQVFNGLFYVIVTADAFPPASPHAPPVPVVVNVSYGMTAGPHDGSSLLESAMDALVVLCRGTLAVVLPAGNHFLSRCHAHFGLAAGESVELPWRVQPDDLTESHMELWLPVDAKSLSFTVVAPGTDETSWTGWNAAPQRLDDATGRLIASAVCYPPGSFGTGALVRISIAPTGDPSGTHALAPAGLWRVRVTNAPGAAAVAGIDAWIQRGDTAPGQRPRGRQSYFDDARYRRFDDGGHAIEDDADPRTAASIVKRGGTLNAIATGRRTIVVGGYRVSDHRVAPYSAAGPLVGPGREPPSAHGPDALLPSDDAPSHPGRLAAGTRSGSCGAMHGTSVAAPLAARRIALAMAAGLPHDRTALFAAALADDPAAADKPAPARGGGGRLLLPARWPPRIDLP